MELIFNNLEVVWFILITVLFAGFFLLEGFILTGIAYIATDRIFHSFLSKNLLRLLI